MNVNLAKIKVTSSKVITTQQQNMPICVLECVVKSQQRIRDKGGKKPFI